MEGVVNDNNREVSGEEKTVKCSMCRKVKTSDHFFNPNSDSLFHVCDYCRYLRKTKYKKRRVKVELERPVNSFSRTRESPIMRSNRSFQGEVQSITQTTIDVPRPISTKDLHVGVIPSKNWVDVADGSRSESDNKKCYRSDSHYALNHPIYRFQSILANMCTPPQLVCNEKNQIVVLRSSIPPTPKSLIFCCNPSPNGNPIYVYDKLWANNNR